MLARIYFEKGNQNNAMVMYNKALDIILRTEDKELTTSVYDEIKEKNVVDKLSEKNIYNLAVFLEKVGNYEEAIKIYNSYINLFPTSKVRPKVIYRAHLLFKKRLKNEAMAQNILDLLNREYPGWIEGRHA